MNRFVSWRSTDIERDGILLGDAYEMIMDIFSTHRWSIALVPACEIVSQVIA